MKHLGMKWTAAVLTTAVVLGSNAQDQLRRGFENPPENARPLVWWHWLGGNITKEGALLDVEWMHRVGLGGFQAFEGGGGFLGGPDIVKPPVRYMSPEWKEAFKAAVNLGVKYGMEMAVAGSPGWSESGGPWVEPRDGMKKLVWSELRIAGGNPFHGRLPHPPSTTGPFQNVPAVEGGMPGASAPKQPEYYADSEVVAYKAPAGDMPLDSLRPAITASSGQIDASLLSDGDLVKPVLL